MTGDAMNRPSRQPPDRRAAGRRAGAGALRRPLARAAPLGLAVFAFGGSFGVLARASHVPAWQAVLASASVFAGSAQFAALSVVAAGGSQLAAAVTGALLNLRYLATGVAVGRLLPGALPGRVLASQLVTDESYALGVAAGTPEQPDTATVLPAGGLLWLAWVAGTLAGALLGPLVGDPRRLGLDAAFPAAFAALLWPMLRARPARRAALGGAAAALLAGRVAPVGLSVAAGAVAGLLLGARRPRPGDRPGGG